MTTGPGIHPSLLPLAVDIASLTPDPRNARAHDERNIKSVVDSYREHGQLKPIVVQRRTDKGLEMVIRAGNASTEAAKRLGWTQIAAVVIDGPDKAAIAYALRDNRTAELAEWDLANLGAELRVLQEEGISLESVGWEEFEYKPLIAAEWEPAEVSNEEFQFTDRRVGIMFTRKQFEALKSYLGSKPTADLIMERLEIEVGS